MPRWQLGTSLQTERFDLFWILWVIETKAANEENAVVGPDDDNGSDSE